MYKMSRTILAYGDDYRKLMRLYWDQIKYGTNEFFVFFDTDCKYVEVKRS